MLLHKFFEIVKDPTAFAFQEFNLFKVFYVKYDNRLRETQNYRAKGSKDKPTPTLSLLYIVKALLIGIRNRFSKDSIIFYGASGRHAQVSGINFDIYNARIVAEKGRNQFTIVEDRPETSPKQYLADFHLSNLQPIIKLLRRLIIRFVYKSIAEHARRIVETYPELEFSQEEAVDIIFDFYTRYLVYGFLIKLLRPSQLILICHYGREPFIAAAKRNNVPIIELMHGLITSHHHFYNYPQSYQHFFSDSLFPDKLAVYGDYWKEIVVNGNMFPPDSVIVGGYYLKVASINRTSKIAKTNCKRRILIATQWPLQDQYLQYIHFLKANLNRDEWQVVIKVHPAENQEPYKSLTENNFIVVANEDIYKLLSNADILISISSTVLYEAMLYDVCAYVLIFEEIAGPSMEIVNSSVGKPLTSDQLPVFCDDGERPNLDYYFAPFQPNLIFK